MLENLKDRAVTIFAVYLKVGRNYYVEIENLEDQPLVLRPFETYRKAFGPIDFYSFNMRRVDLDPLLANDKTPKRLVLSIGDGKYVVPSRIRRWHPITDYFKNHMTILPSPVRSTFKAQDVGGNVKFVVEIFSHDGEARNVMLHERDHGLQIFRDFLLTEECLRSRDALESYLKDQAFAGRLSCEKFEVHDMDAWRRERNARYDLSLYKLPEVGAFQYYILGRLFTMKAERSLRKANRKLSDST